MTIRMCSMTMLVLACSVSLFAQTGMFSDSSMKKSNSAGKQMTMTGCVGEKDGKYMLKDKKHPDGVELMSSDNLKPHVGHKVSVTGMMQGDSAMAGDKMSKDSMSKDGMAKDGMAKDGMAKDGMAMSGFKVTSMKMVSEKCTVPDAMMNK
jgi:pentapeptide MXKDX repeat protein